MKMIRRLGIGLFLSAFAISCFSPPEYPVEPKIEFDKVKFVDVPDNARVTLPDGTDLGPVPDTLILTVKFKDGDGDIGLSDADAGNDLYAERFYFDQNGKRVPKNEPMPLKDSAKFSSYLRYRLKKAAPFDTLPNFNSITECINWQVVTKKNGTANKAIDTLYFQLNPDRFNIFVHFFTDTGVVGANGPIFKEYDFMRELCTTYDGRLPILSKDLSVDTPLEGTIKYNIIGTGFKFVFGNTPMKLRIQIQDRKLNKSNIIYTDSFQLLSIK